MIRKKRASTLVLGVSIIELLIGIALFAVIAIFFASVFLANSRIFSDQKTTIHVASQNRLALDEITNQVRKAVLVVDNCTICGTNTQSTSTVLILGLWPIDSSGNAFDPNENGLDYFVYKLDDPANNSNLIKKIFVTPGNGSTRQDSVNILASKAINIIFDYDNTIITETSEVTITLTNEDSSIHKTHSYNQETKATLRNFKSSFKNIFFPYVIHSGVDRAEINLSVATATNVTGNIYSNFEFKCPDCTITGDLEARSQILNLPIPPMGFLRNVTGETVPLPIIDLPFWENAANINSDPEGGQVLNCGVVAECTFGPKRIEGGTLYIGDGIKTVTVKLTGPIHVNNLTVRDNATLTIDDSCPAGLVVVANGKIDLRSGSIVSSDGSKYLLMVSKKTTSIAIEIGGSTNIDAILYAYNDTERTDELLFTSPFNTVNGSLLSAGGIIIGQSSTITHAADLNPAQFSTCE